MRYNSDGSLDSATPGQGAEFISDQQLAVNDAASLELSNNEAKLLIPLYTGVNDDSTDTTVFGQETAFGSSSTTAASNSLRQNAIDLLMAVDQLDLVINSLNKPDFDACLDFANPDYVRYFTDESRNDGEHVEVCLLTTAIKSLFADNDEWI